MYRKETAAGDYSFGNQLNDFWIDVPEAVAAAVKSSLLLWLGEWYLDNTVGTPYMQGILGPYSQQIADTTIQNQIMQVEGVTDIASYSSTLDESTRAMSVQATIDTEYGTTEVDIQNYRNY